MAQLSDVACASAEKADDGLKDPEIIHQLHQGNKRGQWQQVRDNDVADLQPTIGPVHAGCFQRVLAY